LRKTEFFEEAIGFGLDLGVKGEAFGDFIILVLLRGPRLGLFLLAFVLLLAFSLLIEDRLTIIGLFGLRRRLGLRSLSSRRLFRLRRPLIRYRPVAGPGYSGRVGCRRLFVRHRWPLAS